MIICAKNEEENLERFLPRVLEQDYPEFEVVVVNDCSTDGTEQLLSEMSVRYKHLRYTSIPSNEKFLHGKKLAVTIGLNRPVTTMCCSPMPIVTRPAIIWLQKMTSNLTGEKKIVLGYGAYMRKKGLLNMMIRYETVFTAIQYLSYAIAGHPIWELEETLPMKKPSFLTTKDLPVITISPSGDDDLFINEIAVKKNTAVEISKESHTLSIPKTTSETGSSRRKDISRPEYIINWDPRIRLAGELISRFVSILP